MKHIITQDGSSTFFSDKYNDHYHSTNGAIQESMHIFIKEGLLQVFKDEMAIFEMGFGTGLNALLTYLNCGEKNISYVGVEKEPIELENVGLLNYPEVINNPHGFDMLVKLHMSPWNESTEVVKHFWLHKVKDDLSVFQTDQKFDLIYFDAFSPESQPELWTEDIFTKMYDICNKDALLLTYSAKGSVRRALEASGFKVERLDGPPGKREILRAKKE